jgi:hypothetical protein
MNTFTLTEKDHIIFQLYEASTNPIKIKSRRKSFFTLLILSLLVICLGYLKNEAFMIYYGLLCTLIVLCFGNLYLRWRSKRHYIRHVKNYINGESQETVQVEIVNDQIRVIDKVSESFIKISEIILVNEIKEYYFLKLSTGPNLVIPKTVASLNDEVNTMIKKYNIAHVIQLNWKWG